MQLQSSAPSVSNVLLHPGVGVHRFELPLDLVLEGLLLLLLTSVHDGIRDHCAGLVLETAKRFIMTSTKVLPFKLYYRYGLAITLE